MNFNNFLYSGFEFGEDEDLLKFKYKMINSILVIVTFFSVLFGALSDLGVNDIGPIHSKVDYIYGFFTFIFIFFLRLSKSNYTIIANCLLITSLITFTSALIFVPQDEFRMIWFYLLIFVAYILNGSSIGMLFTIASIAIILCSNFLLDLQLSQTAINSGVLGLIIGSFLSRFYSNKITDYEKCLQKKNADLKVLASTDSLTGIMNKRAFNEISEHYFKSAQRDNNSLTLMLLDLDHFKKINDSYGHKAGDLVLTSFVKVIESLLRKSDILARIGGEEFAILLFETQTDGAFTLAEKIRKSVKNTSNNFEGQEFFVTTSIGISQNNVIDTAFDDIFIRTDKALYQAKSQGRDQTCILH